MCNVTLHHITQVTPGQVSIMSVHTHQSGFGVRPRHVSRDKLVTSSQCSCHTIPVTIIQLRNCPQSPVLPAIYCCLFQPLGIIRNIYFFLCRKNFSCTTDLNESAHCQGVTDVLAWAAGSQWGHNATKYNIDTHESINYCKVPIAGPSRGPWLEYGWNFNYPERVWQYTVHSGYPPNNSQCALPGIEVWWHQENPPRRDWHIMRDSHWSREITWPGHWPVIGGERIFLMTSDECSMCGLSFSVQ